MSLTHAERIDEARRAHELSTASRARAMELRTQWEERLVDLRALRKENNFAARIAAAYGDGRR